ncbi:MAG: hypothetical protein JXD19_06230, partial [Deltaproteobacteria bacterium]|nr:hypothetical protein [Deltaproteobacteria bacterium]
AHDLGIPVRLAREILFDLVEAHVLTTVKQNDDSKRYYQPAQNVDRLTIKSVIDLLNKRGKEGIPLNDNQALDKISSKIESMDRLMADAPENIALKDL